MTGPTTVPWRVITASTAAARQLMRFMTFSSSSTRSSACSSQSRSPLMKNVVLPESPYGRLDDEVVAEAVGELEQLVVGVARGRAGWARDGTPASLPSWVVTIFESSRWRSSALGSAIFRPISSHSFSVSSSKKTNSARPPRDVVEHLLVRQEVVVDVLDRRELTVRALLGDEDLRVRAARSSRSS